MRQNHIVKFFRSMNSPIFSLSNISFSNISILFSSSSCLLDDNALEVTRSFFSATVKYIGQLLKMLGTAVDFKSRRVSVFCFFFLLGWSQAKYVENRYSKSVCCKLVNISQTRSLFLESLLSIIPCIFRPKERHETIQKYYFVRHCFYSQICMPAHNI